MAAIDYEATMKFDGIDLPPVYELESPPDFIGQRERTANGTMRQDVTATKREWTASCRVVSLSDAEEILDYITGNYFASGALWIDEFGDESNTVEVFPDIESVERVQFTDADGNYHSDGKEITFVFEEA